MTNRPGVVLKECFPPHQLLWFITQRKWEWFCWPPNGDKLLASIAEYFAKAREHTVRLSANLSSSMFPGLPCRRVQGRRRCSKSQGRSVAAFRVSLRRQQVFLGYQLFDIVMHCFLEVSVDFLGYFEATCNLWTHPVRRVAPSAIYFTYFFLRKNTGNNFFNTIF